MFSESSCFLRPCCETVSFRSCCFPNTNGSLRWELWELSNPVSQQMKLLQPLFPPAIWTAKLILSHFDSGSSPAGASLRQYQEAKKKKKKSCPILIAMKLSCWKGNSEIWNFQLFKKYFFLFLLIKFLKRKHRLDLLKKRKKRAPAMWAEYIFSVVKGFSSL